MIEIFATSCLFARENIPPPFYFIFLYLNLEKKTAKIFLFNEIMFKKMLSLLFLVIVHQMTEHFPVTHTIKMLNINLLCEKFSTLSTFH